MNKNSIGDNQHRCQEKTTKVKSVINESVPPEVYGKAKPKMVVTRRSPAIVSRQMWGKRQQN